jgi:hypothetical protein
MAAASQTESEASVPRTHQACLGRRLPNCLDGNDEVASVLNFLAF